jgi:HAD superfamily hydrolase (TIGR01509 family)
MIPSNIKAVIFDVDGVIIDSEPVWVVSHNEFIERHQLSVDERYKATLRGIGLKELIMQFKEKFHIDKTVDELLEEYREIFYKHFFAAHEGHLLPGVEECVRKFSDKGYQLAIATGGHTGETMHKMLEEFKLAHFFQVIVSSDEVERGKPNPDVFFHAAEKLQRKPEECLVIEDSVNGVLAGKAAGMTVYGVVAEETIYNQLKDKGADEIFHHLSEIVV